MTKVLLSFFLTLIAVSAFASDGSMSMEGGGDRHTTSSENRQSKSFSIIASPVEIGPSSTLEQGAAIGIFLTPKNILMLEGSDGNTNVTGWGLLDNDSVKIHSSSASVAWKHFVGNSFYVKTSVDYRQINYHYDYANVVLGIGSSTDPRSNYEFNGSSVAGSFAVGNQWQFNSFTIGCDWFGITAPLSYKIRNQSVYAPNGGDTTSISTDLQNREDTSMKQVAYQALRFYLGASF